jgi:hypothetical protein
MHHGVFSVAGLNMGFAAGIVQRRMCCFQIEIFQSHLTTRALIIDATVT